MEKSNESKKVRLYYYGILQEGEVIDETKTRVRVKFKNQSGWFVEAWRKKTEVEFIQKEKKL